MEALDAALTYAANAVLIVGGLYFLIAFVVFVWEAETRKAQPMQSDRSVVSTAAVTDALPTDPVERAVQPAVETEVCESMSEIEADQKSDDDAIASVSGVPSSDETIEAGCSVLADAVSLEAALLEETKTALPSYSPVYRGMSLSPIVQTTIVIPKEGIKFLPSETENPDVSDRVNGDSNDDAIAAGSVPLPTIARSTLKIWTGRHRKKVVPLHCLPSTLTIPVTVRRYRWRDTDVIKLSDLQTFAVIEGDL